MSCSGKVRSTRASSVDFAAAREVADAGVEQDDASDRQRHRRLDVLFGIAGARRRSGVVQADSGPNAQCPRHRRHIQPLLHRLPSGVKPLARLVYAKSAQPIITNTTRQTPPAAHGRRDCYISMGCGSTARFDNEVRMVRPFPALRGPTLPSHAQGNRESPGRAPLAADASSVPAPSPSCGLTASSALPACSNCGGPSFAGLVVR